VPTVRAGLPSLLDLEAFEAAARHGSFVAAAAELHLTPSAISHRVKSLERHLGVSLFHRMARRIELTEHGRGFLPSVSRAFDELTVSTVGMFGWGKSGRRINARVPISYAVTCVAPRLHEFTSANPGLEVRMVSAIWADTLAPEDVEVDVRYGDGTWPGHRAELLQTESATVVWAPAYEKRVGRIRSLEQLAQHPRVHVLGLEDLWAKALDERDIARSADDITVDTSLAALEIASAGQHSAVVLTRFAARHLADGRLRSLSTAEVAIDGAHYLVTPSDRTSVSADALLFIDWLRTL
jgi:LysR family glycine cleavage system transcriptional activator